jgi:hypothetical protein
MGNNNTTQELSTRENQERIIKASVEEFKKMAENMVMKRINRQSTLDKVVDKIFIVQTEKTTTNTKKDNNIE